MRIAVLSPGGVGGLVATLLAAAGHDVVTLARASTAAHITQHGLHLTSDRFGELRAHPQAAELLADPVDATVVTTKATSLVDALDRLPPDQVGGAVCCRCSAGLSTWRCCASATRRPAWSPERSG